MRMAIQELNHELRPKPGRYCSFPRGGGYPSVEAMQRELFYRQTRPSIENRWIKFVPKGVIIIEFSCNNFGYRDYDFGDYNIKLAQLITLEDD